MENILTKCFPSGSRNKITRLRYHPGRDVGTARIMGEDHLLQNNLAKAGLGTGSRTTAIAQEGTK
jgi:hypothetical protein